MTEQVKHIRFENLDKKILIAAAHGENWEITESRDVIDTIEKYLSEHGHNKEGLQETGSFALHYTPSDALKKSFSIPLTGNRDYKMHQQLENNRQGNFSDTKGSKIDLGTAVSDIMHSRL